MPDVTLARAPVEPGKEDRLREWYAELQRREDEVVETLDHEGVYTETAFLDTSGETSYLYVSMESDDLEAADEAGDEEAYDIDEEHHEVLAETLAGEWESLETVGHYVNPGLR
jgi:hypothetical protein